MTGLPGEWENARSLLISWAILGTVPLSLMFALAWLIDNLGKWPSKKKKRK